MDQATREASERFEDRRKVGKVRKDSDVLPEWQVFGDGCLPERKD